MDAHSAALAQDQSPLSPHDEIKTFLLSNVADPVLSLDVPLQFARGMSKELRTVLAQWDAVVESLEHAKADGVAACNN